MTPDAPSNLKDSLALDEGRVPYAYRDSLGFWTVGVGRLIDKRKGARLPADVLERLDKPVQQAFANLDQLPLNVTKWPAARLPEILIDELLDRSNEIHGRLQHHGNHHRHGRHGGLFRRRIRFRIRWIRFDRTVSHPVENRKLHHGQCEQQFCSKQCDCFDARSNIRGNGGSRMTRHKIDRRKESAPDFHVEELADALYVSAREIVDVGEGFPRMTDTPCCPRDKSATSVLDENDHSFLAKLSVNGWQQRKPCDHKNTLGENEIVFTGNAVEVSRVVEESHPIERLHSLEGPAIDFQGSNGRAALGEFTGHFPIVETDLKDGFPGQVAHVCNGFTNQALPCVTAPYVHSPSLFSRV